MRNEPYFFIISNIIRFYPGTFCCFFDIHSFILTFNPSFKSRKVLLKKHLAISKMLSMFKLKLPLDPKEVELVV